MFSLFTAYLVKKTTLIFPSSWELWEFFKLTDVREFRLDSAKCSVTGKFSADDIALAKERLRAKVREKEYEE